MMQCTKTPKELDIPCGKMNKFFKPVQTNESSLPHVIVPKGSIFSVAWNW